MTDAELEAIRERIAGATPGPWRDGPSVGQAVSRVIYDRRGYLFGQIDDGQNAKFIAHARSDIEALLAEVERLRK